MMIEFGFEHEPCYVISVAARMVGVHAQTLRYYERVGLVEPSRSLGKQRLYSPKDIEVLRRIKALTDQMGVNLAGVEVVLKLINRVNQLEQQVSELTDEVNRLNDLAGARRKSRAEGGKTNDATS